MNTIYKIKQVTIVLLILTIIGAVFMTIKTRKDMSVDVEENKTTDTTETKESRNLCYYKSDKTNNDLYDTAWLKLSITGDEITGEFQHIPAEKDSKIGKFEGIMNSLDQQKMARTANVWWDSFAEGMNVKEELIIEWGEGSATVGFGEMIDRGDGVYVYKNKMDLSYLKPMSQMDCIYLDEKLSVEKYVRENIKTIATDKAVLGGTWYVVSTLVNPSTKTGEVTYEDGHIQKSRAVFTYTYETQTKEITFNKFDIKK